MDLGSILGVSGLICGESGVDLEWICGGSGVDLEWIWSGSGVDLGVDLGEALEVWPGYAPVWSSYAPVWGLCRDFLEKLHFFVKMRRFSCRCSSWLQITKNNFLLFRCFLPPYFGVSRSLV